jgi:hypoxanthine-DNA glycosylase
MKDSELNNNITSGLAPIVSPEARVLILGSLPGSESIAKQQYYAKPTNRFWKILAILFNESIPITYTDKIEFLKRNKIALWDVIKQAERKGSLDSAIKDETVNDIALLLRENTSIRTIAFNGSKAAKTFSKYIGAIDVDYEIKIITLYSTSPANAKFSLQDLVQNWKQIL